MDPRNNHEIDEIQRKKDKIKAIRSKIKGFKLPTNKLFIVKNEDKLFHETWDNQRSKLNIPVPFQSVICGKQNSGKSVIINNLILHQGRDSKEGSNRPFKEIYVYHCDGESTKEYKNYKAVFLKKIPKPEDWSDCSIKKLLILEDIAIKSLKNEQLECLKRAVGYCSTHKNLSVIITLQDPFDIVPFLRRCCNLFILFPNLDYTSLAMLSKKIGLHKDELRILFEKFCKCNHDSIWLDNTENGKSPYKLRLNGFDIIEKQS
jgi:hypothetical protein